MYIDSPWPKINRDEKTNTDASGAVNSPRLRNILHLLVCTLLWFSTYFSDWVALRVVACLEVRKVREQGG